MGKAPVLGWVGMLLAGAGLGGALCTLAGCTNSKSCQSCQAHGPLPASQTVYNPQTLPNGATAQAQAWNKQGSQVPGQPMVNAGMTPTNSAQPWANSPPIAGTGNTFNRTPGALPGTTPMGVNSMPAGTVAAMPGSMGNTPGIRPASGMSADGLPSAGSPTAPGLGQPVTSARVPTSMNPTAPATVPSVPVIEHNNSTWANSAGQPASVDHETNYHVVPGSAPASGDTGAPLQ